MDVFGGNGKGVEVWGPAASVEVKAEALGSIIGNSWILEGVNIGAKEIVDVRKCFEDVAYIYALGNDQSRCIIVLNLVVFIGEKDCKKTKGFNAVNEGLTAYYNGRISEKTSPMTIGIGSFVRTGWLIGIDISGLDVDRSLCHASATFLMELK